jgi:hypothetical protein
MLSGWAAGGPQLGYLALLSRPDLKEVSLRLDGWGDGSFPGGASFRAVCQREISSRAARGMRGARHHSTGLESVKGETLLHGKPAGSAKLCTGRN